MIDIHVHILPSLDDGSQTIDESVAMANAAVSDEVECLVATPHGGLWGVELSRKIVEASAEDLRQVLRERGIELRLLSGIEVYVDPTVLDQIQKGTAFTLNGSRYILVELPMDFYPNFTEQVLFQLQVNGYVPVLAHPERCRAFQRDLGGLRRLIERGMISQVTAGSIVGDFGRAVQQTAEMMLEHNLAHIIASDAHSPDKRPPVLSKAVERAARIVGHDQALAMVTAVPEAIINNQAPHLLEPLPVKQKKGWALWR